MAKMQLPEVDFQILFESVPGLYLIILPDDFTIVAVNDAYLNATMTKREDILGHRLFDIFPDNPDDVDASGVSNLRHSITTAIKDKTAHTMAVQKYDIRRPDGTFEERFWSPLNKPVLNSKKEVIYIIHRVEDVTEFIKASKEQVKKDKVTEGLRARVEKMEIEIFQRAQEIQEMNLALEDKVAQRTENLEKSEKKYRITLDTMLEGIQIIDFDWRYIYVNDSLTAHGRFSKDELIGHTMMEKYPGIENSEVFRVMKRCMENKTSEHLENEFVYPDGTRGWFELSIQSVPEGIFVLSIDISKRKRAEDEIQKLNESLEKKIIERTAQLEAVNKELESFSYSVSHDLRAPLRAVDGYAKMLEEDYGGILDDEGKRLLGVVQYNAQKMGCLIDDLLAFSRLGKKQVSKSAIDMKELLENVLIEINKSTDHNAQIKVGTIHPVKADYALMNQVMINLISNAIKYSSKEGKPEVEINSIIDNEEIVYSIKDNGVGFDMQYVHKLFGVFQRLHTMDEFEGTGVGLAIVQRIINKHGGRIWADGIVGEGATFYFGLPI